MSELNREQIIKALECWVKNFDGKVTDFKTLCEAIVLIKELTEENERLRDTAYRLECEVHRERADTVEDIKLRFAMRFGTYTDKDMTPITEVFWLLDKFAKEMLEGDNGCIS